MTTRDVFMVHVGPTGSVFVKELEFFREQGGFKQSWAKSWIPLVATSIEDARRLGCHLAGARPYSEQAGEP
jgi:hypothetical protein